LTASPGPATPGATINSRVSFAAVAARISTPPTPSARGTSPSTSAPAPAASAADLAAVLDKLSALQADLLSQKSDSDALRKNSDALRKESEELKAANADLQLQLEELRSGEENKSSKEKDTRFFLPLAKDSPYFAPPKNRTSTKPYIAPLKGDATADALTGEALAEYQTAHWVCSALHDFKFWTTSRRSEWNDAVAASDAVAEPDRSAAYLEAAMNHVDVAHDLLLQRLEVVRTRAHLKSKTGGLTVTDQAMLDYVQTQMYGLTPDMNILDQSVRAHIEAFQKKVIYSKLNAGAKAALTKPSGSPKADNKKQRKERLKRDAAAKAKLLQQGE
jgi:hypothetical protein